MRFTFDISQNPQGELAVRFSWREFLPKPLSGETLAGYVYRAYRAAYKQEVGSFGEPVRKPDRFKICFDQPKIEVHDAEDDTWAGFTEPREDRAIRDALNMCIAKAFPEHALNLKEENGVAVLDQDNHPRMP